MFPTIFFLLSNLFTYTVANVILPRQTIASTPISNRTNAFMPLTTQSASPSLCCFVLQETIEERWWADFSSTTMNGTSVVSVVTIFTRYINTTVTNYSKITTWATGLIPFEYDAGYNYLRMSYTLTAGPKERATELSDASVITTGDVNVTSSNAFYVYSTIVIITVPAVTAPSGQLVCTTAFTIPPVRKGWPTSFSGRNSYAEAYFRYPPSTFGSSDSQSTLSTRNLTGTRSDIASVSRPVGTTVSFSTPFIYVGKRRGKTR